MKSQPQQLHKLEGQSTAIMAGQDAHPLLVQYALTGTIKAVDTLTKEQKNVMDELQRSALLAKESRQYQSLPEFIAKGVSLAFFSSAFSLDTPLAKHLIEKSRSTAFSPL